MQITGALLAVVGIAAALPGGGEGYSPTKPDCYTSSTCKAYYHTTTKTIPYHATHTITKTEYKPHYYTTKAPKVYTETTYIPQEYNVTKTIPITKTITIPDYSTTVVCKTSTVNFNRTSVTTKQSYSTCPETKKVPATTIKSTWYEHKVTTSTPCPYTTVEKKETYSTTVCTESSSKCETTSSCKNKAVYPTQPPQPPQYGSPQPTY
ncbi:hypothetical protein Slin15195_G084990 [Septoria linicola]|uniref:Uncharacterized protein n=1 Tax=Septoria linicola TaxID=215465 RepID=A0A9Q9AZ45_9PEZI|nr:hypothetical protein Slin14017_G087550 [Septoria linicola]USW55180.1 hypothetical protein Slin15195_G084990 [Septoria linicola]